MVAVSLKKGQPDASLGECVTHGVQMVRLAAGQGHVAAGQGRRGHVCVGLDAVGNDLGFDAIFARQLEALAREGDLLFLHSTSGESENLIRAAEAGRRLGMTTVAFLAKGGGRLRGLVDRALVVPTDSTARAQEIHLALGHAVCQVVEESLWGRGTGPAGEPVE